VPGADDVIVRNLKIVLSADELRRVVVACIFGDSLLFEPLRESRRFGARGLRSDVFRASRRGDRATPMLRLEIPL
jgi:hypothetical protein